MLNICNLIRLKPISKNPQRFSTRVSKELYHNFKTNFLVPIVDKNTAIFSDICNLIRLKPISKNPQRFTTRVNNTVFFIGIVYQLFFSFRLIFLLCLIYIISRYVQGVKISAQNLKKMQKMRKIYIYRPSRSYFQHFWTV